MNEVTLNNYDNYAMIFPFMYCMKGKNDKSILKFLRRNTDKTD